MCCCVFIFVFKQKTAYEMRISDWSSDVCSSDLPHARAFPMTAIDRQAPFRHWTASQRGPHGQVAEWLKAADCKSARVSRTLVRIQPCPPPSNPDRKSVV